METPVLETIEQVSSGWINKYVLTYRMPDGSAHVYESASRKKKDAYERELRAYGKRREVCANKEAANIPGEPDANVSIPPDALSIVGRTEDDEILLIREFRYPLNSWCIAFPAGLMEPGEDIAACAARELSEETGYAIVENEGAPAVTALPQAGLSSTGMTDESVQICFARIRKDDAAHPEGSELIEPFTVPISGLRAFLDANETPIGTRCQLMLEAFAHAYPQDTPGSYLA